MTRHGASRSGSPRTGGRPGQAPKATGPEAGPEAGPQAGPESSPETGLEPGLHVVSTPIGAARDISLRALDILGTADLLLAEDTRSLRRLLDIHGIRLAGRPLWAYHDHNGARVRPQVLAALEQGRSVAMVSEAGTPLIADPGWQMVRAAIEAGHGVRAAPGASALLAALAVAGLPTDRFAFLGFPPGTAGGRRSFLAEAMRLPMTSVIYESPRRVHQTLAVCCESDSTRPVALCRELTKRFEEVLRGSLATVVAQLEGRELKGECVLVLGGAPPLVPDVAELDAVLNDALGSGPVREVAAQVALRLGLPRRQVYQRALELRRVSESDEEEG